MKSWIKRFFGNLWNRIAGRDAAGNTIFDDMLTLAVSISESLVHLDLNQDGRVAARAELLAAAEELGLGRLKRLVDASIFEDLDLSEIKRWLAIARTARLIAANMGMDKVPGFAIISLLIESAYALVSAPQTAKDFAAKGITVS